MTKTLEAAAKRIYEMTADQPWEAASLEEEERMREIARAVLRFSDRAIEAAADAIIDAAYGQELPEAPEDLAKAALEAAVRS